MRLIMQWLFYNAPVGYDIMAAAPYLLPVVFAVLSWMVTQYVTQRGIAAVRILRANRALDRGVASTPAERVKVLHEIAVRRTAERQLDEEIRRLEEEGGIAA